MRKNFFYAAALVLGLAFTATACSDDDDTVTEGNVVPATVQLILLTLSITRRMRQVGTTT